MKIRPLISAVFAVSVLATTSHVQAQAPVGDDLRGQRLFLRCSSCHALSDTGVRKIGPSLQGVIGRKVASLPGYTYSPALKAQSFVWDEAMLDKWLTQPSAVVPGTAMAFAGIPKAEDRKALISYLKKSTH